MYLTKKRVSPVILGNVTNNCKKTSYFRQNFEVSVIETKHLISPNFIESDFLKFQSTLNKKVWDSKKNL